MIKCILITYSLVTGVMAEYSSEFSSCDRAAEFVSQYNTNNTEEIVVISLNPIEEDSNDDR